MLRLITFDACNTLFHVRGSPGELYSNVASRFGVEINPKPLMIRSNTSFENSTKPCQTLVRTKIKLPKNGGMEW